MSDLNDSMAAPNLGRFDSAAGDAGGVIRAENKCESSLPPGHRHSAVFPVCSRLRTCQTSPYRLALAFPCWRATSFLKLS